MTSKTGRPERACVGSTPPVKAYVTASFGVAVVRPRDGGGPEALLHEADRALYDAKQAGRNRVAEA